MKVSDISLSNFTKNLILKINAPIIERYNVFYFNKNEKNFVEQYRFIKDITWPECNSYDDFINLPEKIKSECETIHNFSPTIYFENVKNDSAKHYKTSSYVTIDKHVGAFLLKHKNIILDQTVVDFACKHGAYSFFALLNGAKSVLALDIRQDNINIADSIKKDLDLQDSECNFVVSDIHDYKTNKKLCGNKDTVFVLGVMYHIHDHVNVLESILGNNSQYIVIETGIFEHEKPIIWWKEEPTFEPTSGWNNNKDKIIVGYPTISWFDLLTNHYGYHKIDEHIYKRSASVNNPDEYVRPRAILLYKKSNRD